MTERRRVRGHEHGQATVEAAMVLPLLVLLGLVVAQVGALALDLLLVNHAAREAARAAAVDPAPGPARTAALGAAGLRSDRLSVELSGGTGEGDTLTVVVTYRAPTDVPLVGRLIADVVMRAPISVRVE